MFIWVFWSHYLFVMCLFSNNSYIILYQLFIHFSKTPTISHWVYICPLLGLAHFIVAYFDNYWYVAIGCVLQGSTFGVINSQSPAVMYEAAGLKRYPQGMALVNLMYGFGNLFSNVIGGKYQHALYVNVQQKCSTNTSDVGTPTRITSCSLIADTLQKIGGKVLPLVCSI